MSQVPTTSRGQIPGQIPAQPAGDIAEHTTLWQAAWRGMRSNRLALVGMLVLAAVLFMAFVGPLLSPYDFLSQDMAARNQRPGAARSLGLPTPVILRRYIVPNATGPVIVAVSAGLGNAMVLESAFSFLGIGVNPPTPPWGNMVSDGLRVWRSYPHLLVALVLGVTAIAFAFIGDGLNDA